MTRSFALSVSIAAFSGSFALAGAQASAGAVPLVGNGGFETPVTQTQAFYDTGTTIGEWKVTAGSVDLIGPGLWQAARGRQSLDLSGNRRGTIEQTIATTPGRCYTVTFALAGNTFGAPAVKTGYARVAQGLLLTQKNFRFDTTGRSPQNMGYVWERFTFCAQESSAVLSLTSTTDGVYGPAIDDVVVIPRPRCVGIGLDLGAGSEETTKDG
ncbi:choice-of-anchor C family protein [Streptosporangium carneum]|uniref:choice-of-anchor C family protein n=1 Tax=Streptosporangium carneum TaxID=47481 RepID=UPI0022F2ECC1|nr:choice-of-anchor C family protein [Streptosporangium carneum]